MNGIPILSLITFLPIIGMIIILFMPGRMVKEIKFISLIATFIQVVLSAVLLINFDYSAGGLSFISNRSFDVGVSLTASIKDPIEQDTSVLDFEFEVARVVDYNGKYKVGCKFFDEVDEEFWHSLMS